MKSLVFFNNKGGVGKTTLACNVVSYLNMHVGLRVLLVDADPQCNATQTVLSDDLLDEIYRPTEGGHTHKTIYSYLSPLSDGDPEIDSDIEPVPASSTAFKSDVIPGHPSMSLIEDRLSRSWADLQGGDPVRGYRVTNWLSQLYAGMQENYDLVVFDVGPSLGALNRTVLLSCDYIVTPFGSDIFSLLGISNISSWVDQWAEDYERAVEHIRHRNPDALKTYAGVQHTQSHFRLAGYSVQQYVQRRFKAGRRPVKAYDEIMEEIPEAVFTNLEHLISKDISIDDLELGHIPFLYSLVPMAQSNRSPIQELAKNRIAKGAQVKQVDEYANILALFCVKLLDNIGLSGNV